MAVATPKTAVEVARRVTEAIGRDKVGIRLSPNSALGDLQPYDAGLTQETYAHLAEDLNGLGLAYIHISVDPKAPPTTLKAIRSEFKGTLIHCNNFTGDTAEAELQKGDADLIAFGRSFLANPDLVNRIIAGAPLNPVDYNTLYTAGEKGYTDYKKISL